MQDRFFLAILIHWTKLINMRGDATPPHVDGHCLMPHLPDEHGFLACTSCILGIFPRKLEFGRQNHVPLLFGKVIHRKALASRALPFWVV
jgi:hypothetical protein